jgi:hypothetical protein
MEGVTGLCQGGCIAPVDSGTSTLLGPKAAVAEIAASVGAIKVPNVITGDIDEYVILDCSEIPTFPPVTFTINGIDYSLNGEDYVLQVNQVLSFYCKF